MKTSIGSINNHFSSSFTPADIFTYCWLNKCIQSSFIDVNVAAETILGLIFKWDFNKIFTKMSMNLKICLHNFFEFFFKFVGVACELNIIFENIIWFAFSDTFFSQTWVVLKCVIFWHSWWKSLRMVFKKMFRYHRPIRSEYFWKPSLSMKVPIPTWKDSFSSSGNKHQNFSNRTLEYCCSFSKSGFIEKERSKTKYKSIGWNGGMENCQSNSASSLVLIGFPMSQSENRMGVSMRKRT